MLQLAEDWLYGEDAEAAAASAFTAQRLRLAELCADLAAREKEHKKRREACERVGVMVPPPPCPASPRKPPPHGAGQPAT